MAEIEELCSRGLLRGVEWKRVFPDTRKIKNVEGEGKT